MILVKISDRYKSFCFTCGDEWLHDNLIIREGPSTQKLKEIIKEIVDVENNNTQLQV